MEFAVRQACAGNLGYLHKVEKQLTQTDVWLYSPPLRPIRISLGQMVQGRRGN